MLKTFTSTGTAAVCLTPGPSVHLITIQNTGAATANLSFDGGSGYTATNGKVGTNPTASLGFQLAAGLGFTITRDVGGNSLALPIVAIGSTTLQITTDDLNSV